MRQTLGLVHWNFLSIAKENHSTLFESNYSIRAKRLLVTVYTLYLNVQVHFAIRGCSREGKRKWLAYL